MVDSVNRPLPKVHPVGVGRVQEGSNRRKNRVSAQGELYGVERNSIEENKGTVEMDWQSDQAFWERTI